MNEMTLPSRHRIRNRAMSVWKKTFAVLVYGHVYMILSYWEDKIKSPICLWFKPEPVPLTCLMLDQHNDYVTLSQHSTLIIIMIIIRSICLVRDSVHSSLGVTLKVSQTRDLKPLIFDLYIMYIVNNPIIQRRLYTNNSPNMRCLIPMVD